MYSDDLITITNIRENSNQVSKKISKKSYPCPVLANNKILFYAMSESEYKKYQKLKKLMEIDSEVQEAKISQPRFSSGDALVADLLD